MLIEKTFNSGSVILNFAEESADGLPILLLHGVIATWQDWDPVIRRFSENHIFAPDLRGCGKSGRVPRGYRIEEFASDIADFIQVQIAEPVVIIGHSLGAAVTLKVTADLPALVRAVILEEPGLYGFILGCVSHMNLFPYSSR